jgi:hypothetical protein
MSAMTVLADELFEHPPDTTLLGMPVVKSCAIINLEGFASIQCAECPKWEGAVNETAIRLFPRELIQAIRDCVLTFGKEGGLLGILKSGQTANAFVARGRIVLEKGSPWMLVGCGPGLTPAGDDFLTGAMLASSPVISPYRTRIECLLSRTTYTGRTLLWTALRGRFPAYMVDFIETVLCHPASEIAVVHAVRAACAHGETSGTDALAGFCWQIQRAENHE